MDTDQTLHASVAFDSFLLRKWQKLLDLFIEAVDIPFALITQANQDEASVLLHSGMDRHWLNQDNPVLKNTIQCCKIVTQSRKSLIRPDLTQDGSWSEKPETAPGCIAYMGFPILWPDGEVFGAICAVDTQERQFSEFSRTVLSTYAEILQDDLSKIRNAAELLKAKAEREKAEQLLRESEEHFLNTFQSSPVGLVISSVSDGKILYVNSGYQNIFGYSCEEAAGKSAIELNLYWEPEDRLRILEKIRRGEPISGYELQMRTKSGERRIVLASLQSTIVNGNQCLITSIYDITSLRNLEKEAQLLNERYMLATRAAQAGIWDWDIINDVLIWDNQMYRIYDAVKEEFSGAYEAWLARIHPEDLERADLESRMAQTGQKEYDTEFRIHTADGNIRYIKAYGDVIRDAAGLPIRMVGVNFDITERKRIELELTASEARYREIFHNNAAVQLVVDPYDSSIVDANRAACEYYGCTLDEIKTKTLFDINPNSPETIRGIVAESVRKGSNHFTTQHFRADRSIRDVEIFNGRISIEGRNLLHVIIYDITESTRAIIDLAESEKRFRLLFENAPDGIVVETDYKITYINQKAVRLFRANTETDLIGTPFTDHFIAEQSGTIEAYVRQLNAGLLPRTASEETIVTLDGTKVEVELSAVPFVYNEENGALIHLRDMTIRRDLEQAKTEMEWQLRQKQKLESIGTLAGGVAHEINNPINGIINYAELMADGTAAPEQIQNYSRGIIQEGKRIAEIVKNLLSFARQEKQTHSPAQIKDIIDQSVSLLRVLLRHDQIELEVDIPDGLPSIKCRSQQIQQVVMNLITNARDALNAKYIGYHENKIIRIYCALFEKENRRWMKITVKDNGSGIPDDVLERVFDPFFTTKPRDEGTGLGLSISHGIVKDHHGELYFETEPGEYTKAILVLPVDNGWTIPNDK